jgi:hypothetical protein
MEDTQAEMKMELEKKNQCPSLKTQRKSLQRKTNQAEDLLSGVQDRTQDLK